MSIDRKLAGVIFASVTLLSSAAVADTLFEVENARAAARAGYPLDDYQLELLDRWGALSGSNYADPEQRRAAQKRSTPPRERQDREDDTPRR